MSSILRRLTAVPVLCAVLMASAQGTATGAIAAAATPGGLDLLMGTPLLAVTDDGFAPGAIYGHPPSFIPGMALATPIGPMGFGPSHERLTAGTLTSSGSFLALTTTGPIAGSTVFAPDGANAIDFFLTSVAGSAHTFEITAVGTLSTSTIIVAAAPGPTYVGFGAFGESIIAISIVNLPFPSPTTTTWITSDIRVLPAPGTALLVPVAVGAVAVRRRRN